MKQHKITVFGLPQSYQLADHLTLEFINPIYYHSLRFIPECKQAEDEAISLINACGDERTVIVGNFRSLINEMEDEEEDEDYDDYDDFQWIHNFE